jgi:phosphoribosylaminoimidazole-succinocarboxamide synthase
VKNIPPLVSCTELGLTPDFAGKVREIFDLGDQLLLVATDRISAFDVIMDQPVPGRGALLTQMAIAWFEHFGDRVRHHHIHGDAASLPDPFAQHADRLQHRVMLVHKADRYDIEAVVRGYLAGSGFADYERTGAVCGHPLPPGLARCEELPEVLFTPATKADEGHDENISEAQAAEIVGEAAAREIKERTLYLYRAARDYAAERGIIIADTKFEFGLVGGELTLIDEILTPDSSRYWEAALYAKGREQDSMDKQILRNYLQTLDWDRTPPPPRLDPAVLEKVAERYLEIFRRLFPERVREMGW